MAAKEFYSYPEKNALSLKTAVERYLDWVRKFL